MSLLALPAELKICVSESISPIDCFNLGVTCKDNWSVLKSFIEKHRHLAKKYGSLTSHDDVRIAWNTLDAVLDNPDVGYHIREIELESSRNYAYIQPEWLNGAQTKEIGGPTAEKVARYVEASEKNRFIMDPADPDVCARAEHSHDVSEVIEQGHEGPIFVTLFSLLPRLKVLRIQDEGDIFWILHGLRNIATAYKTPTPHMPLQSLTKVYIAHWDTELCARWTWLHCFIRIPSLRIFQGHMIGGELEDYLDEDGELRYAETPTSNVTELTLTHSNISAEVFDVILSHFKNLNRFQYENAGAIISFATYDPRSIIGSLVRYCKHSLEHLCLQDTDGCNGIEDMGDGPSPLSSPREFKVLKTLQCGFGDIVTADEENWANQVNESPSLSCPAVLHEAAHGPRIDWTCVLPTSIECVHFDGYEGSPNNGEDWEFIESILLAKDSHLPMLKQLYTPAGGDSDRIKNIKRLAMRKGVSFEALPWFSQSDDIYTASY